MVAADPSWPSVFDALANSLRSHLAGRALDIIHVGSTSVPGLDAKPVIDIDLIVADPAAEGEWLPALEQAGFVLTVREPWWHEHRMLEHDNPRANVHVFGPNAAEPWKHRIFRDHLRRDGHDRSLYAAAKKTASEESHVRGETVMDYNRRKQEVIREIYARAFASAGLT
ncbi:GrpB family protein [Kocuria coralli]|uniref:GrpB family protein n=1 Tax=Kocuria coralli TaxID=1461025 RepID=UPI001FE26911|nr:GrpB family protein [Kocuria coralli]